MLAETTVKMCQAFISGNYTFLKSLPVSLFEGMCHVNYLTLCPMCSYCHSVPNMNLSVRSSWAPQAAFGAVLNLE